MAGAGFRRGSAAATPPPRASPTRRAWTPRGGHVAARQRQRARGLAARDGEAHGRTQFDDALRRLRVVGRAAPLRRRRVLVLVLAVVGLVAPRRLRINEVAPRRPLLGFRRLRRRRLPRVALPHGRDGVGDLRGRPLRRLRVVPLLVHGGRVSSLGPRRLAEPRLVL